MPDNEDSRNVQGIKHDYSRANSGFDTDGRRRIDRAAPVMHHLSIKRFRGISELSWHPAEGTNVILGGGDVGKTAILEAIGLFLSPTNAASLADTDYHLRKVDAEFVIEAVVSLPPDGGINQQLKPAWPWLWNGTDAVVPDADADGAGNSQPVYRLRVCAEPRIWSLHSRLSSRTGPPTTCLSRFVARLGSFA